MRSLVAVSVVMALVAGARAAHADGKRVSVGGLSAAVPAGWQGNAVNGSIALVPDGAAANEITIIVTQGSGQAATTAAMLDAAWADLGNKMTVSGRKAGPSAKTHQGFDLALSFGKLSGNGQTVSAVVGALRNGSAQAVVVILLENDAVFEKHSDAIAAIIDGIAVRGAPAAPTAPAAGAAAAPTRTVPPPKAIPGMGKGLSGVWVVLEHGLHASLSSTTGTEITTSWEVYVFLPDGRYSSRLHPEGLDNKSVQVLTAQWPDLWGTYGVQGNQVTLTTSNGIKSTYKLAGGKLVPTGRTGGSDMVRADTGPDLRISGTYRRSDHTEKNFPGALPTVTFTLDGRFVDANRGVMYFHQYPWKGSDGWSEAQYDRYKAGGSGHYRISNNTLYLVYDDGRVKVMHFAVLPTGGTAKEPKGLYVNDRWLTRI